MDIPTIVTLISVGIGIATFFIGRVSAGHNKGREMGEVRKDVSYIKESVMRIEGQAEKNMTRMEGRIDALATSVNKADDAAREALQSAKSAHKRIDVIEGKQYHGGTM